MSTTALHNEMPLNTLDTAVMEEVKVHCERKPGMEQHSDTVENGQSNKPMLSCSGHEEPKTDASLLVDSSTRTVSSTASDASHKSACSEDANATATPETKTVENNDSVDGSPVLLRSVSRRGSSRRRFFRFNKKQNDDDEITCRRQLLERRHTDPTNRRKLKSCLKKNDMESKSTSELTLPPSPSSVSFGTINIHEHEVTVGDNPSVMSGAPISLDWKVQHEVEVNVDEYESSRGERRTSNQMRMPATVREELLIDHWEIPYRQVRDATQEARQAHVQRIHACKFQFADGARLMLEQTAKACKKTVSGGPTKHEKEIKSWTKAHKSRVSQRNF